MSKAQRYGMLVSCIPNRRADEQRRAKIFQKNQDWTWSHQLAVEENRQKREAAEMARQKEAMSHE